VPTLEVRRGGGIALLGRNGAGKTTVLKALTGVLKISGIRYLGKGVKVFLVPQHLFTGFKEVQLVMNLRPSLPTTTGR